MKTKVCVGRGSIRKQNKVRAMSSTSPKILDARFDFAEIGESASRDQELQALAATSSERGAFTGVEKSAPRDAQHDEAPETVFSLLALSRSAAKRTSSTLYHDDNIASMEPSLEFAAERALRHVALSKAGSEYSSLQAFRNASDEAHEAQESLEEAVPELKAELASVPLPEELPEPAPEVMLTPSAVPTTWAGAETPQSAEPEHIANLPLKVRLSRNRMKTQGHGGSGSHPPNTEKKDNALNPAMIAAYVLAALLVVFAVVLVGRSLMAETPQPSRVTVLEEFEGGNAHTILSVPF